jgi:hypothetical protein
MDRSAARGLRLHLAHMIFRYYLQSSVKSSGFCEIGRMPACSPSKVDRKDEATLRRCKQADKSK